MRADVGGGVGGHHLLPLRTGQRRVDDVVLEDLVAALAHDLAQLPLHLLRVLLALADPLDVEVVQGDAPLEQRGEQRVVDGLPEVGRVPLLLARHPEDAVADVVVVAEHVGELVVHVVVRVLPLLGRLRGVPLPVGGVDLRVVHPVPLAVHDVVADLHVLEDLGHPEERCAGHHRGLRGLPVVHAGQQGQPAGGGQATLHPDHPVDVRRVLGVAGLLDLGADRVELASELLDLVLAEVGVLLDVCDGHAVSPCRVRCRGCSRPRAWSRRSAPVRWAGRTRRRCAGPGWCRRRA